MKKEYIEKFLNGKLVFRLNGDACLLEFLQDAVESRIENKRDEIPSLLSAKAVGEYAYEQNKEKACISWDVDRDVFGWCDDDWYADRGCGIIPIEEAFSDKLPSNTEEWMKLL